ncbi:MAG: hypothetical protein ACK58X_09925 [Planctomycetota bacterium]
MSEPVPHPYSTTTSPGRSVMPRTNSQPSWRPLGSTAPTVRGLARNRRKNRKPDRSARVAMAAAKRANTP